MRISITDRCDLRCKYCMPAEGIRKLNRDEILRADEILSICRAATDIGIDRFKITGGEPLVRGGCVGIIRMIKDIPKAQEVTMTTNGQLLAEHIEELAEIGVDGINVSLDTLDEAKYRDITRLGDISKTLDAIDLSARHGIKTKINCLVQRGINEDEITKLAEFAMDRDMAVRYIELMPVGFADEDTYFSSDEVMTILKEAYPDIEADDRVRGNGPAIYYRVPGRKGSIGLISSIRGRFCSECNRIRLTSTGQIKPCLCYDDVVNIKPYLSGTHNELTDAIKRAVEQKPRQHCFENISRVDHHAMAEIGG